MLFFSTNGINCKIILLSHFWWFCSNSIYRQFLGGETDERVQHLLNKRRTHFDGWSYLEKCWLPSTCNSRSYQMIISLKIRIVFPCYSCFSIFCYCSITIFHIIIHYRVFFNYELSQNDVHGIHLRNILKVQKLIISWWCGAAERIFCGGPKILFHTIHSIFR